MGMTPGASGLPATFNNGLQGQSNANIRASAGSGTDTLVAGTDNMAQVFNLSAARTVVLPSVGVAAGDLWMIENRGAFDLTVQASGGSALTVANGANMDATIQGGYTALRALVATPTTPAQWLVEYVSASGTFIGTITGCTTSPTATGGWQRTNKSVTLSLGQLVGTSNTTACTITTTLPPSCAAARTLYAVTNVINSGTDQTGLTSVAVASTTLTLYSSIAGSGWTASGTKGLDFGVTMCWTTV